MSTGEAEYVWMEGKFVTWAEASVPILTHALNYGTAVFEGIRAYPADGNLYVFRLRDHMVRLEHSAKIYRFKCSYTVDQLCEATLELLRKNRMRGSVYIRPIVYVSAVGIGLDYTGKPVKTAICAVPFNYYFDKEGLRVCVANWRRISDTSTPPLAKASGNYLNSSLAKVEARMNGYDEAILLEQSGSVSEGTGENIFIVEGGRIHTPPLSSSILRGITRNVIFRIARDLGYEVVEREISRSELYVCDEAFFTGTAAEVTAVLEIDGRIVGDGRIGQITSRIREALRSIVTRKNMNYAEWLTPVY